MAKEVTGESEKGNVVAGKRAEETRGKEAKAETEGEGKTKAKTKG